LSTHTPTLPLDTDKLATMTIRDIIDAEPRALEILAPYGFDLCCGGSHLLGEALAMHGVDPTEVLPRLTELASSPRV
jgi:iron-sulfur cluster repair protein YtfE (RIC family)